MNSTASRSLGAAVRDHARECGQCPGLVEGDLRQQYLQHLRAPAAPHDAGCSSHADTCLGVKADIERDIKLGVLERVPANTPVTWCSRMHVVAKKNGDPHRVVDSRPVNAASRRQTHHVEPPYSQARGIPGGTWKFT